MSLKKSICTSAFLSLVTTGLTVSSLSAAEEIQWFPYPESGVNLGQGFDLLMGQATPASCITFEPNYDKGLDTAISFTEINSFTDTMASMKVSGSGKLKLALIEASASLSLANESKVTKSFKDVGVNARVFLGASYVAPGKDSKYPPSEGVSALATGENPSVKFSDIALNEWKGLSGATTGDAVSAYSICGSGFVSTVISGVELNAILSSENSTYDDNSKFSGELKAKILGGLATIQANAEGAASAKTNFQSISVKAQIRGKSDYQIPLNGDALQEFIKELPKNLEGNARPILIAVTPYGNLFPEVAGAYSTASDFSVLVDAWFIVREARSRILENIKNYGSRNIVEKDHFLSKSEMHDLVERTYEIEAAIQAELRQIVAEENTANNTSNGMPEKPGDTDNTATSSEKGSITIFDDMVAAKAAREIRLETERTNIVRYLDNRTISRLAVLKSEEESDKDTQDVAAILKSVTKRSPIKEDGTASIQNDADEVSDDTVEVTRPEERVARTFEFSNIAQELYISALLSTGGGKIDLDYLLTAREKRSFELALRILMRGNTGLLEDIEGLTDPELFSKVSNLLEERDDCLRGADKSYLQSRTQAAVVNGTSILAATAKVLRQAHTDSRNACEAVYEAEFKKIVPNANPGALTSKSASIDIRYVSEALFKDVIARHVYEDRFLPIKVSACESDPKSSFCSVNSVAVRDVVDDLIEIDAEYVSERSLPLFSFDIKADQAVPTDNLKEISRLPRPSKPYYPENCGTGTKFYCK